MPALGPDFRRDERNENFIPKKTATSRRKFTEEIWAKALPEYFGGASAHQVCAKYGMSKQTLYSRVGGAGKQKLRAEAKAAREEREREALAAAGASDPAERERVVMRVVGRALRETGERMEAAAGTTTEALETASGRIVTRLHHSEEIWAAARKDYEVGGFTVPRIAERYGLKEATVKKHAFKEGWSKMVTAVPAPLTPPDDPAQIDAAGKSVWAKLAHEAQRAPEGAWSTWLFQGGRGAGKTRAGAEWLAERAERTPNGLFALVGPTQHDVREVMIEGPSGLRSLPGREKPRYESSRRKLKWKNGATAFAFSAEEPERLRGPQFMGAWADEFCCWPKPEETLALLRMGLRLGEDPRLVVTTTPKPIAGLRKLRSEVSCVTTQAATGTNAANLARTFLSGLEALYGGTRLAKQELDGVLVEGDGALWRADELARARGPRPEKLDRVVVGVDPPASEGGVCGIVVAGRVGSRAFVLEDASAAGLAPLAWARRAVEAGERHGAAKIVAEANQGGDMVRTMLVSAEARVQVKLVRASEGKRARAEPVAALYQQGRVTHCGMFLQLEEELMAMGSGEGRLDRADALVWTLTALMLERHAPLPKVLKVWED